MSISFQKLEYHENLAPEKSLLLAVFYSNLERVKVQKKILIQENLLRRSKDFMKTCSSKPPAIEYLSALKCCLSKWVVEVDFERLWFNYLQR